MIFGDERVVFVYTIRSGNDHGFRFRPYIKPGMDMPFYRAELTTFRFKVGEYMDTMEEAIMKARMVYPGLSVYVPNYPYMLNSLWDDFSIKIFDGWRFTDEEVKVRMREV